jgi:hypothetical protein
MNLLCAIGLHARIPDQSAPTKWGIFSYTDEYKCRRCTARWTRWIGIGIGRHEGPVTDWERIE